MEDEQMPSQSSIHFYSNWAKERIDEIDATLASLESKAGEVQADVRAKANQVLADLREKRDAFRDTIKKQAESNEAAWIGAKARLETDWTAFEAEVQKYVETFGKQAEQRQAAFQARTAAQLKAWNEVTDKLLGNAMEFTAERRGEIDAAVKRMKADAAAAQEKLEKVNRAGSESWSALNAALAETRAAFDRANLAAHDAFKRVK
jgi:ElaB/YqjD/DUF883 family membrane-anchored ribosome-binding protein